MAKKRKRKTIRQMYKDEGFPSITGKMVNDLFAEFGIEAVQLGLKGETFDVEPKAKKAKVACPFCKAKFMYSHQCNKAPGKRDSYGITREYAIKKRKAKAK